MHGRNQGAAETALDGKGREIVERLGGTWSGRGGLCRCPAHDDRTPSLSIRPGERRLLFHCFAGCETGSVIRALIGLKLLDRETDGDARPPLRQPVRRCGTSRLAARLWAAAKPIEGSPAEAYLRKRGLRGPGPHAFDLRYHPRTPCGRGAEVVFGPALLAAVRDERGLVAVHRTFLGNRSMRVADRPSPKRALGPLGRGAVRLRPPGDGALGWAEGVESALAAMALSGIPCWATLGVERFARVALPPGVDRLLLFLDNDSGGRRAETLVRARFEGTGLAIEVRYPAVAGEDWNDVLVNRTQR